MSRIHVSDVQVLETNGTIFDKFRFKISYRMIDGPLTGRLVWRMLFLPGSTLGANHVLLKRMEMELRHWGPTTFDFVAHPPSVQDYAFLNDVGLYVVAISCSYREQEFERFHYYVKIDYEHGTGGSSGPVPAYHKLLRTILVSHPVVHKTAIKWDTTDKHDEHVTYGQELDLSGSNYDHMPSLDELLKSMHIAP